MPPTLVNHALVNSWFDIPLESGSDSLGEEEEEEEEEQEEQEEEAVWLDIVTLRIEVRLTRDDSSKRCSKIISVKSSRTVGHLRNFVVPRAFHRVLTKGEGFQLEFVDLDTDDYPFGVTKLSQTYLMDRNHGDYTPGEKIVYASYRPSGTMSVRQLRRQRWAQQPRAQQQRVNNNQEEAEVEQWFEQEPPHDEPMMWFIPDP